MRELSASVRVRPTRAEIDLDAIVANARQVAAIVGPHTGILAVVKADAYGHGAVPVARALRDHAPILGLAVSLTEEGFELRRHGIGGPIIIMGGVYGLEHRDIAAAQLTPVVSDLGDVAAFARASGPVDVHVKLDTGMSRLGVRPEHFAEFLEGMAAYPNVRISGFMTHLASADTDPELTRLQLERFAHALPLVRARAPGPLLVHAANSAGTLHFPDARLDAVRPGIVLYQTAMRFVSAIVQLRDLQPGDTVSYGGTYRVDRPARIATLPIGYADGYPRRLSSPFQTEGPTPVLVRGRRCPVVGTVCMDMLMVDVTSLGEHVAVGDEVTLFGDEITTPDLARRAGLIEYEITCGISKRVPRLYRPVRM